MIFIFFGFEFIMCIDFLLDFLERLGKDENSLN